MRHKELGFDVDHKNKHELLGLLKLGDIEQVRDWCIKISEMSETDRLECIEELGGIKYSNLYGLNVLLKEFEKQFSNPIHIKKGHVDVKALYEKGTGVFSPNQGTSNTFLGYFNVEFLGTPLSKRYKVFPSMDSEKFKEPTNVFSHMTNFLYGMIQSLKWFNFGMTQMYGWIMSDDPEFTTADVKKHTNMICSYSMNEACNLTQCVLEVINHHYPLRSNIPPNILENLKTFYNFGSNPGSKLFEPRYVGDLGVYSFNRSPLVIIPTSDNKYILVNRQSKEFKQVELALDLQK